MAKAYWSNLKSLAVAVAVAALISFSASADERTRWSVFNPEIEFRNCGNSTSNVARAYCNDELDKKLRRAIRWADSYVASRLLERSKKPDNYSEYDGKYALEAVKSLKATSNAYVRLIKDDCKVASWQMRGGSGEGLAGQSCEIDHRTRLFGRYKIFLDDPNF